MGIILGKRKQQTVRTSNTLPTSTPPPDPGSRDSGSPARQEERSMPDGKETDEQATPVDTDTNESESSKDELSDDGTSREGEPLRLQESSTMSDIDEEKNEAEGSPSGKAHRKSFYFLLLIPSFPHSLYLVSSSALPLASFPQCLFILSTSSPPPLPPPPPPYSLFLPPPALLLLLPTRIPPLFLLLPLLLPLLFLFLFLVLMFSSPPEI